MSQAGSQHTTRRTFLAGVALAIPTASVAAAFSSKVGPDDEIANLFREWETAEAAAEAALHTYEAATELYRAPRMPSALIKMESDAELQLCAPSNVGRRYEPEFIERFRTTPRTQWVKRPLTDEEVAKDPTFYRQDYHTITEKRPWPEAQARADRIVAAWDRWQADIRAANAAAGTDVAKDEWDRTASIARDLRTKIASTAATTVTGLILKARVAADCFGGSACVDDELESELASGAGAEAMSVALVRDLLRLQSTLTN